MPHNPPTDATTQNPAQPKIPRHGAATRRQPPLAGYQKIERANNAADSHSMIVRKSATRGRHGFEDADAEGQGGGCGKPLIVS